MNTPTQGHAGWSYSWSERRRSSLPRDAGDTRARFRPDDLTPLFPLFEFRTVFCLLTLTPAGGALFLLWHVKIGDGSLEGFRGHPDCFRQRGMGVNGETDVRGAVSAWYAVYLDVPTPPAVYVTPVVAVILTAGLGLVVVKRAQQRERRG